MPLVGGLNRSTASKEGLIFSGFELAGLVRLDDFLGLARFLLEGFADGELPLGVKVI